MDGISWEPGFTTLATILELQAPTDDGEAHLYGIGLDDRVFNQRLCRLTELEDCWVQTDMEIAELLEERGPGVGGLVEAWRDGPQPPPIILAHFADGTYLGLDGYHRLAAARLAGEPTIPAWVATEVT